MSIVSEITLDYKLQTLFIEFENGESKKLPIAYLQKKANNTSPIVNIELYNDHMITLQFGDSSVFEMDLKVI